MRILSWNVNGLRSALSKGLMDLVRKTSYDVLMFQEVKTNQIPIDFLAIPYKVFLNASRRKGYSGTLTLSNTEPISVKYGIGNEEFDSEGRVISLEFSSLYVINVYFPNSGEELKRLEYKIRFNHEFQKFVTSLPKPAVICGDFNVAHEEIDIARPKENENHAGFTSQEREWFHQFLLSGFVDTYRLFVKEGGHYTWWSYRFHARERNVGWRIDYCLVSEELKSRVRKADILTDLTGSDHAPVTLDIEV
ncbi:exodeoxyribonuclease III [Metallosphaera tengchongensis]|uniref:Exodeoxyribonuclease III n=1 Tax=Metallosphaera tengchongensis TaxID=1532350 RepID=A0A6N0NQX2_9CREN|nr:exodeoxyribonuclease III [Metallosphaera tengchongensis]QKQ99125.1 exodeoxyribonuclease III [Metallosphaera tengchongensis]